MRETKVSSKTNHPWDFGLVSACVGSFWLQGGGGIALTRKLFHPPHPPFALHRRRRAPSQDEVEVEVVQSHAVDDEAKIVDITDEPDE